MASEIEYRHVALKVDLAKALTNQQQLAGFQADEQTFWRHKDRSTHLVFVEHGSSRDFDERTGRPSRNWYLQFHGEYALRQAIEYSIEAEAGHIWMKGRDIKAENYIKFYRDLLKNAADFGDGDAAEFFVFELDQLFAAPVENYEHFYQRVEEHPYTAYLRERGRLKVETFNRWGKTETKLVLTAGGSAEQALADFGWLLVIAGDWLPARGDKRRLFQMFGGSAYAIGQWIESRAPGKQAALFETAA